jgi:hypothetical protein
MSYQQLDKIADLCNPVFMLILIGLAIGVLHNRAWSFLLRQWFGCCRRAATVEIRPEKRNLGRRFPFHSFAVALALCVSLVVLKRRFWPAALGYLAGYGALMLSKSITRRPKCSPLSSQFRLRFCSTRKPKKARPLAN